MESTDGHQVRDAVKLWSEKEGSALTLLGGIKKAAEIYFTAVGKTDIDYSKESDEFVHIYRSELWKLPYFEAYAVLAHVLTEIMVRLQLDERRLSLLLWFHY